MSSSRPAARIAKRNANTQSSSAGRRTAIDPSARASQFSVNATQAKNQFGEILRRVRTSVPVVIEKHGTPLAVVLDVASYEALLHRARSAQQIQLDALRDEFDAMYARMQGPRSRRAMEQLSKISADEMNSIIARRMKRRG